jgi:hypothetical protein
MATPSTKPETAAEARDRFFVRYAAQVGGDTWAAVQRHIGLRIAEPTTVEGWIEVAETIRTRAAQVAPAPAAPTGSPALRFSFEVRAKIGEVEGPLTISGDRLQDVLKAVQLLPQTPGLNLVEVARDWRTLPDGTPICPKHSVPMRKREKQGDEWYSHSVEVNGKQCYCKGYAGKDSPGWEG